MARARANPSATASVELVFDNADGKLGGEYASYSEVSLKRVVERDGNSVVFPERRALPAQGHHAALPGHGTRLAQLRDHRAEHDLARHRGASPKTCAVSSRRRPASPATRSVASETETRIGHTRENLERLGDLREEVEKQLRHLQRQAATARRYQALKQEERELQAQLLALRLREVETEAGARAGDHARARSRPAVRACRSTLDRGRHRALARRAHRAIRPALDVQGRYYEIGAEISRAEQAIEHAREMRARQRQELDTARTRHAGGRRSSVREMRTRSPSLRLRWPSSGRGSTSARAAEEAVGDGAQRRRPGDA